MAILKNVEIYFPKLVPNAPSKRFNKQNPTWEVQLRTTSKEVKKAWEALKLKPKAVVPDEGDTYFRVNLHKRSKTKDGDPAEPVEVVDAKLQPLDPSTIGNGSVGNIRIFQYEYSGDNGKGVAAVLMAVQITKLIKYEPRDTEGFDDEGDMEIIEPEDSGDSDGSDSDY